MSYEYRVVPFKGFNKNELDPQMVSAHMQMLLNVGASEGWEFNQSTNVSIEVQPGCLNGLFGQRSQSTKYDMLIFRRPITEEQKKEREARAIKMQEDINNDTSKPRPITHIKCPTCKGFALKLATKCRHCGEKLKPSMD
jgi:hypothetical protein